MRRLIGFWLGVAAVVACGTQIDLGSALEPSRDGGIETGAGSSSGSTGGDATTPVDEASSPSPRCIGASFTESFVHDAGAGAPTNAEREWDPHETGWDTPTSSNMPGSLTDGNNVSYPAYVFKAAPAQAYVYIERELDTACAKLELGIYVQASADVEFDLFNVELDDGSTLVLHYRELALHAGTNRPGTGPGDASLEGALAVKLANMQKLRVVFSTDGSVVAQVGDLPDVTFRVTSPSHATKFVKLRVGPNVVAKAVDVTVANFSLEAKE